MDPELKGLLIAAGVGLFSGVALVLFFPQTHRELRKRLVNIDWKFSAAGAVFLAAAAALAFREAKPFGSWLLMGLASLNLCEAVLSLRHGSLKERTLALREVPMKQLRQVGAQLAVSAVLTVVGGLALQRAVAPDPQDMTERELPSELDGRPNEALEPQ